MPTLIDLSHASMSTRKLLASEVATRETDPAFYSAISVLPNPDTVLRKLGYATNAYDAIAYDAHVMGELRTIRAGTLAWEWRLQPGGDQSEDIKATELCEQIFADRPANGLTWSDVIWNMASAMFYGFSVHEITWERQGHLFIPSTVLDRPQRRFQFDTDNQLRLIQRDNAAIGVALGDYKWLLTRHMMRHDNPYGVAIFSACFWPYTFKHNGYKWFTKFIERFGIPHAIGKYAAGTSDLEQSKLLDSLVHLIEDAVATLPKDSDIELLESKSNQQSSHIGFIDLCNRELSKALTSQTIATEVQDSGSRAVAEVGREREQAGQQADRRMIESTMNQLCRWITALNYPNAVPPTWTFYEETHVHREMAQTLGEVLKVAPIKRSEYYKKMQLTEPTEDDDVILPQSPSGKLTGPENAEFSRFSHDYSEQDDIGALSDEATLNTQQIISGLVKEIADTIDQVDDLSAFARTLPELLSHLDQDELREQMTLVFLLARLKGQENT